MTVGVRWVSNTVLNFPTQMVYPGPEKFLDTIHQFQALSASRYAGLKGKTNAGPDNRLSTRS